MEILQLKFIPHDIDEHETGREDNGDSTWKSSS
jgi:hypothetical protein